ncbi:hypothetical protein D4A35_18000 (plasmid) [Paraclostridium bifermentans]|uniref:Solute-binding protein family 5 domain-containing protein n=1 Tax=Paraclostridium bifermentans TaxID=1490 RepID=A0A5P3XKC5_PARBF|nr:ABC transporter substrate-binding protein [Paraclostridium bifermentans]QEZ70828.1 hypothetical protein D4A35_18000 [Paraclostridium bifermentans]
MNSSISIVIDSLPIINDLNYVSDYTGKLIFSSTSCPLFLYDSENSSYINHACTKYEITNNYKTYKFFIDKSIKWSDGKKVEPKDYYNSFIRIINNSKKINYGLLNILNCIKYKKKKCTEKDLGIFCDSDSLTIELVDSDLNLIKTISNINFSPVRYNSNYEVIHNISAGKYYLEEINNTNYILSRNKYYFKSEDIKFKKIIYLLEKNPYRGIELFNENKVDITCNTIFPIKLIDTYSKNQEFKTTQGNINVSLIFTKEIPYEVRNILYKLIDSYEINTYFNNVFEIYNDFKMFKITTPEERLLNKNEGLRLLTSLKNKIKISIGYDNFYPNKMILQKIKCDLNNYGIIVNLVEDNYYLPNNNIYDMKLILTDSPYQDIISNFESIGLILIKQYSKEKKEILLRYIKLINEYRKSQDNEKKIDIINELKKCILELKSIIPLFKIKNYYLINPILEYKGYGRDSQFKINIST